MTVSFDSSVFIVDDDEDVRVSLGWLIEAANLRVETFPSAERFLKECDLSRPGCLVLDMKMPGMDGLELLGVLRARELGLPVIAVSGHADPMLRSQAKAAGAIDLVEKPINGAKLLDRIRAAIGSGRSAESPSA